MLTKIVQSITSIQNQVPCLSANDTSINIKNIIKHSWKNALVLCNDTAPGPKIE
jgi:hypothetical protein